ncbi:recombinase [Nitrospirillum amazonense]|uniref:Recombinase n=1 Tax=Nitrospirillum amazonense TaxID=28077 RepID=A0A560FP30_9PROT|nr:recombinase family protein [Nitrospirillum amazonense]TWB23374.1 recombinase [Nitrospirillum amazonense]
MPIHTLGRSPRAIAADLNRDGVPGPLGRDWSDTTIRGHTSRGTGIINNELYTGVMVWNRLRFIKDPSSGKRVSRLNPEEKWIRTDVPDLRIVDDVLWQAVRARQTELAKQFEATTIGVREARAKRMNGLRRPAFLPSGLLTCGCGGGKYAIIARDRYGCLHHYRKGKCDNGRTIRREVIEHRVLVGLTGKLVSPQAIGVAIQAYADETNQQNQERRQVAQVDRRALEKVERGIKGIMVAIEDGMYLPTMRTRLAELEAQKAEIVGRLAVVTAETPDVPFNVIEFYKAKVARLAVTLSEPAANDEAREDIRSLVGEVVLTPGNRRRGIEGVLRGDLMGILGVATGQRGSLWRRGITNAVAGPGFEPANG